MLRRSAGLLAGLSLLFAVGVSGASAGVAHYYFGRSFGPGGVGSGSFASVQGIAVDQASGSVYVYDPGAPTPAGKSAVFKFDAGGEPSAFSGLSGPVIEGVGGGPGAAENQIAVDNSAAGPAKGDIYVANGEGGFQVHVYSSAGLSLGEVNPAAAGGDPCGVTVDPVGNLYVGYFSGHVDKYTPVDNNPEHNVLVSHLEGEGVGAICNVAAASTGALYTDVWAGGANTAITKYKASDFGLPTPIGTPFAEGRTLAVDPSNDDVYVDKGNEIAQYSAAGGLLDTFGSTGPGALGGSGGVAVGTSSQYVYAANGANGQVEVFQPPTAPVIEHESVADIAASSGTLQAQIDPRALETTYRFEYGLAEGAYSVTVPVPDGDAGQGVVGVEVTRHVQGLAEGTVYHYRVVAHNALGTVPGPDQIFTTQPANPALGLPDGRQYELVSPAEKLGTEVLGIDGYSAGGIVQASADGSKLTYLTFEPPVLNPEGNGGGVQIYSERGATGWLSHTIATPHNASTGPTAGNGTEYRAFSSDLSMGVVEPRGTTPLVATEAPEKSRTLYLRDTLEGVQPEGEALEHNYQTLITRKEAPKEPQNQELAKFVGASADLSQIALASPAALAPGAIQAPGGSEKNLYTWAGGQLQLVNIVPGQGPTASGIVSLGNYGSLDTRGAVSRDGSSTVWTLRSGSSTLYSRNQIVGSTVEVDLVQGGTESGFGVFQYAAANASKVFFTDEARLTADSTAGGHGQAGEDLYEYDVKTSKLTDLTIDTHGDPGGAHVQGVLGASEDGSYVYFVAKGVLAEHSLAGADNLYVEHQGVSGWEAPRFIAALSGGGDLHDWSVITSEATARVSANGRFTAFMSQASLTGYDNRDINSGAPDAEVFIYDANLGRLACASCNPTGARPIGEFDHTGLSMDPPAVWSDRWVAAAVPSWTQFNHESADYQSRFLSDSGQLFFDSSDALSASDTNGREDVYEFTPSRVNDCAGAESPVVDGCVSLISSGIGNADSSFLDASTSGSDVFFKTRDRLAPEDRDHVFDVYDAHVCAALVPCRSASPVPPPPCSTGDACKPALSPQPAVFGPPPSATFSGTGNLAPVAHARHQPKRTKKVKKLGRKRHGGHKAVKGGRKRNSVLTVVKRGKR